MDLKEIEILGTDIENHWYYRSKAMAMKKFLDPWIPSVILDVGAGSGYFSRFLLTQTKAREAWCIDTNYPEEFDEYEAEKEIHYRHSIVSTDADLVLLMDVLEHIDDDVGLLREYIKKVPRHSRFLITVPAFQFLWSRHDEFLEHKRRYTLNQLEEVARLAELKILRSSYYYGAVFPIAASLRLLEKIHPAQKSKQSQLTRHHPAVNNFLKTLCLLELPLMKFNRIAGISVFCVAETR